MCNLSSITTNKAASPCRPDWEKLTPEWAELSGGRKSMGFSRIVTDTDRQIQVKGTCCDGMGRFYSFFVMAGALPTGCCNGGTQADMS
jgi:hypothetical protein